MIVVEVLVIALLAVGCAFVVVGTVGLLRFPDLATRLHAVAKADNLGLGLIVAALVIHALATAESGWGVAAKLVLIWLLALLATAGNSHLLARRDTERDTERGAAPATGPTTEQQS